MPNSKAGLTCLAHSGAVCCGVSMRKCSLYLVAILTVFIHVASPSEAAVSANDELILAVKKEAAINLHAQSDLTPEGAQELGAAFNKKYGVNVKVNYFPSKGFANDVAALITQSAAGAPPDWDVMILTEDLHAVLAQRKLHLPFNYRSLGIDPKIIDHENGSIGFVHQITLPAYNTKTVAAKDVPKTWEDLLDTKWKDGKLGIFDARYFALLAAGPWGEKKTTEYVKGLSKQRPYLGRLAEVYTRLGLGEIDVAVLLSDGFVHRAKRTGAPIAFADKVEPVLILPYNIAVIKGAAHPNTARLFVSFMVSREAQAIWEKYRSQSSAFIPGTGTYNFLKGKQELLFLKARDPKLLEKWADDYNKILGFTQ